MGRYSMLKKMLCWVISPNNVLLIINFLSGIKIPIGSVPLITRKDIIKKRIDRNNKSIRNINLSFCNLLAVVIMGFFIKYHFGTKEIYKLQLLITV